jgi:hypothetical protein
MERGRKTHASHASKSATNDLLSIQRCKGTDYDLSPYQERQTMITQEILVELWKVEDIPACEEGMKLAHAFLKSCVSALDSGNPANFNARFESYMRHRYLCEKCEEI